MFVWAPSAGRRFKKKRLYFNQTIARKSRYLDRGACRVLLLNEKALVNIVDRNKFVVEFIICFLNLRQVYAAFDGVLLKVEAVILSQGFQVLKRLSRLRIDVCMWVSLKARGPCEAAASHLHHLTIGVGTLLFG